MTSAATTLRDILLREKGAIQRAWLDLVLSTHAPDGAAFFGQERNVFANPLGHTLAAGTAALVDDWIDDAAPEVVCGHLEDVVKVRAVQELAPSRALSFVLSLKEVVREALGPDLEDPALLRELLKNERRVDQMALFAFDIFLKWREKMFELRVDEVKRGFARILKRSDILEDGSET